MSALTRVLKVNVSTQDRVSFETDSALIRVELRVPVFRLLTGDGVQNTLESIAEQLLSGHNVDLSLDTESI